SNDVDDAIDRVGSPSARSRAADDLDALDVLERKVEHVPKNTREGRQVNAASIHQHQQLVAELLVEAADADCPGIGVYLCHLHTWNHAQQVRDIVGLGMSDIILRNDENCGGGVGQSLFFSGNRGYLHIHQVLQAQLSQIISGLGGSERTQAAEDECHDDRLLAASAHTARCNKRPMPVD